MMYGGVIFRVVLPGTERDFSLDELAVMQDFRTEYLSEDSDPPKWTLHRDQAFRFPSHADAVALAEKIPGHCHVTVARDPAGPDDAVVAEIFLAADSASPRERDVSEEPDQGGGRAARISKAKRPGKKIVRSPAGAPADRLASLRAAQARGVDRESREPFWYEKGDMA
jgi:hypothetical protein